MDLVLAAEHAAGGTSGRNWDDDEDDLIPADADKSLMAPSSHAPLFHWMADKAPRAGSKKMKASSLICECIIHST